MKPEACRQIFEEYSNTKLHENQYSWSRFVACGRTDKTGGIETGGQTDGWNTDGLTDNTKLKVTFQNYTNTPKICHTI
jgi:hypothetical protein